MEYQCVKETREVRNVMQKKKKETTTSIEYTAMRANKRPLSTDRGDINVDEKMGIIKTTTVRHDAQNN